MLLGFFLVSIVVLGEYFNKNQATKRYKFKEFIVFIQFLFLGSVYVGWNLLTRENLNYDFLQDIRFWIVIFLETLSLILALKNFNNNKDQVHVIGYFQFLTLSIIPLLVIGLDYFNLFEGAMKMPFTATWQWLAFIIGNMIFVGIFLLPKLKLKTVNGPWLLLAQSLSLSLTLIFSIRLIQIYGELAQFIYGFIFIAMGIIYLAFGFNNIKNIKFEKGDGIEVLKSSAICISIYAFIWWVNIIAAKMIPVEMFAIFKRLAQVMNSYIFDGIKKRTLSFIKVQDYLIIVLIFIFNIGLVYFA